MVLAFPSEGALFFLPEMEKIFSEGEEPRMGAFCFCLSGGEDRPTPQEGVCSSTQPL